MKENKKPMGIIGSREDGEGVEWFVFPLRSMSPRETKRWGSNEKVTEKDSKDERLHKKWSGKDQRNRGEKGKRNRFSLKVQTDS